MLTLAAASAALVASVGAQAPKQNIEKHFSNIRQLSHGGENAEAYWSSDGKRLIFQSTRAGVPCDQIFTINVDGSGERRVSTGKGRTTCGYFFRRRHGGSSSPRPTQAVPACPPPEFAAGYVWPVSAGYDIYRAKAGRLRPDAADRTPGYDAEATIAPDGLIASPAFATATWRSTR